MDTYLKKEEKRNSIVEDKPKSHFLAKFLGVLFLTIIVLNSFGIKYRVTGTKIKDSTIELAEKHFMIIEEISSNPKRYDDDFYNDMRYDIMTYIENESLTKWDTEITGLLQSVYTEFLIMDLEDPESIKDAIRQAEEEVNIIKSKIE